MLQPTSKAYDFWRSPPAKIYRHYYLFDVRNPVDVQKGVAKPILIERGPYTYSEVWEKRNVEFVDSNHVSFSPVVTLHFERNMSIGDESDKVTFLNVPAMVFLNFLDKILYIHCRVQNI